MIYVKRTDRDWKALVVLWQRSDLTIPAFCAKHKVGRSGLYNWRKRLGFIGRTKEEPSKKMCNISGKEAVGAEDWDLLVSSAPVINSSGDDEADLAWDIELCLGADITLRIRR